MKDFLSIGEILLDCVPITVPQETRPLYQMNPGGAPANVACVMAKLGRNAGFIGRVGNDTFGSECIAALDECGVDTRLMLTAEKDPTTLAFVCLDNTGNRSFSFYRSGSADVGMSREHLEQIVFPQSRIFHFGSVSLTEQPSRDATLYAVERAKASGSVISYDPNYRAPLWVDSKEAAHEILRAAALADLIKLSEEEGEFLFGENDPERICRIVEKKCSPAMVVVTRAAHGCVCSVQGRLSHASAYNVRTIDTTGAGDCFLGGLLHCLLQFGKAPEQLTVEEIGYMLRFSNATGSLATSKKGAIPAIPSLEEIEACMRECATL